MYLLEGMARWNSDRAAQSLQPGAVSNLKTYDVRLKAHINRLSEEILGHPQVQEFRAPGKYTGKIKKSKFLNVHSQIYL